MRLNAWEEIGRLPPKVFRTPVPGGWLVLAGSDAGMAPSATLFLPDAGNRWRFARTAWEELELPAGRLPGVGSIVHLLRMFRLPVPGGWLVLTSAPSLSFCPDPDHAWAGDATELEAAAPPAGRGTELEAGAGP